MKDSYLNLMFFPVSQWSCLAESVKVPCQVGAMCSIEAFLWKGLKLPICFPFSDQRIWLKQSEVSLPLCCLSLVDDLVRNGRKFHSDPLPFAKYRIGFKPIKSVNVNRLPLVSFSGRKKKAIKTVCKHCVLDSLDYVPHVSPGLWLMLFSRSLEKSLHQWTKMVDKNVTFRVGQTWRARRLDDLYWQSPTLVGFPPEL